MEIRTIVPEANEWVQTVSGDKTKQWKAEQLRAGSHVRLEVGTVCLVVNSLRAGKTRREWIKLIMLETEGTWVRRSGGCPEAPQRANTSVISAAAITLTHTDGAQCERAGSEVREALQFFTLSGPLGQLLDADEDVLSSVRLLTFETENLLQLSTPHPQFFGIQHDRNPYS